MAHNNNNGRSPGALQTPVRNHYFYGKLLDTRHFTLEQGYFNRKRWLVNRLVTGYGVVCGLDIVLTRERDHVIVQSGLALDKWGREIIVPQRAKPMPVERLPNAPDGEEEWVHLCLLYHECESDPTPVLASDCEDTGPCAADTIYERYKIVVRPGRVPEPPHECNLIDLVGSKGIRFESLAQWVNEECSTLPEDPCIPLGEIFIPDQGTCHTDDIHTDRRPIVYSNDLLYELIVGLAEELLLTRRHGRKG
jgi:hypothetical protein